MFSDVGLYLVVVAEEHVVEVLMSLLQESVEAQGLLKDGIRSQSTKAPDILVKNCYQHWLKHHRFPLLPSATRNW